MVSCPLSIWEASVPEQRHSPPPWAVVASAPPVGVLLPWPLQIVARVASASGDGPPARGQHAGDGPSSKLAAFRTLPGVQPWGIPCLRAPRGAWPPQSPWSGCHRPAVAMRGSARGTHHQLPSRFGRRWARHVPRWQLLQKARGWPCGDVVWHVFLLVTCQETRRVTGMNPAVSFPSWQSH